MEITHAMVQIAKEGIAQICPIGSKDALDGEVGDRRVRALLQRIFNAQWPNQDDLDASVGL